MALTEEPAIESVVSVELMMELAFTLVLVSLLLLAIRLAFAPDPIMTLACSTVVL